MKKDQRTRRDRKKKEEREKKRHKHKTQTHINSTCKVKIDKRSSGSGRTNTPGRLIFTVRITLAMTLCRTELILDPRNV